MTRLIDADKLIEIAYDEEEKGLSLCIDKAEDLEVFIDDNAPTISAIVYPSGTYQCFHCLHQSVIWDNDFTFEDFGYDGDGLVHVCHCANCGAEIEYRVPINNGDECDET